MTVFRKLAVPLLFGAASALALTGCDAGGGSRESIKVVGSSTVFPFAKKVAENFALSNPDFDSPVIESTGTGNGINLFCKGVGPSHPDIANASRRMKPSELETCMANGVNEVVEVQVGLDGIAFASKKGGIMMNLTPEIVYRAIAANPYGEAQTAETWSDVDASLPDVPILVYGPPSTSGTRDALKELILHKGCDEDPRMVALKESDEAAWEATCTDLRTDGGYVDQGEQDNLIVQKISNNDKALGVFGYSYLEENSGVVQGLPLDGVAPTYENITSFAYEGARPLYIYIKKAHVNAIPGLKQFVEQWRTDWVQGGALSKIGMVPSQAETMAANDAAITGLTPMTADMLN